MKSKLFVKGSVNVKNRLEEIRKENGIKQEDLKYQGKQLVHWKTEDTIHRLY